MAANNSSVKKRYRSIDITRGIVVLLSVFVSALPGGGDYDYLRHAYWYGLTITDLVFPAFLTVYGIGLAIVYRKGVKWKDLLRRTFLLVLYGLLFNLISSWSLDFATLRYTGVLQLFALTGLGVVILSYLAKGWKSMLAIGLLIASAYLAVLVLGSGGCEGGVPQRDCNPSGVVDAIVFGENHMYAQGEKGFDPEGILSIFSALSNVAFGFAVGLVLNSRKQILRRVFSISIGLISLAFIFNNFIELNKRLWTPSFAMLASGLTLLLLAILFYLIDTRERKQGKLTGIPLWYLEAFGRNSFLIYFGKMLVFLLFGKIVINLYGREGSLASLLFEFLEGSVAYPHIFYSGLFVLFWSIVAVVMHANKKYVRV
ncbi:heparan-alpha-glucosaminide N-acetyltransferase domain-containing protein [Sutcliffiella horikoshii]|uniref:heparan-alpha-glucosaminide N-acetyltransferase domain-containing protein n=1 Tax=Sutcliffiella horikoshii TaxID=79883 RepID=UPI001CBC2438|nr:heparan-alpha-glucosaminide N-acetyltransferase domain-containing protein [Sutcliffiella horikoshii]UAL47034.1 heparan-alpha-glucosaminide N-acetyltransferase domain-containing protein [Sutcliffiella horikoshii]